MGPNWLQSRPPTPLTLKHAVGTCSDTGLMEMELDLARGASSLNYWRTVTLMTLQQESGRRVVHKYSDLINSYFSCFSVKFHCAFNGVCFREQAIGVYSPPLQN